MRFLMGGGGGGKGREEGINILHIFLQVWILKLVVKVLIRLFNIHVTHQKTQSITAQYC